MPAVADRHVHIGLADPGAVLLGGVTAVRDLRVAARRDLPARRRLGAPDVHRAR